MSENKFTPHYLPETLRDAYFSERTGVLDLRRGGEWRRIYFERGMMALAESSTSQHNIAAVLEEIEPGLKIGGADFLDASAPEIVRKLIASKTVPADLLEQAVRESVVRVVVGAFRWDGGTSSFEEQQFSSEAFRPDVLFTFEVFQRGIQAMANFEPLREVLQSEDRRIRVNEQAFLPLQSLTLGVEQGFLLSRVDGSLSLSDIVLLAPEGSEERVLRLLFGFLVLGLILFEPPFRQGLFSLRDLMDGHRGERKRDQTDRNRVMQFYEEIRDKDARQVLKVDESDGPEAIKKMYESLHAQFHRDRFSPRLRKELKRELGIIENRLLESYLLHQAAVIERFAPRAMAEEDSPAVVDFEKRKELVKTDAQANVEQNQRLAEQYFLKAKDFFREGDYHNCIQFCRLAVKFNPEEAPFHSLMADALLKNPDHKWQRRAEESYQRAVEIDPWNADYLVALGRLYKKQGLAQRARRLFEQALEILPHHSEAREMMEELSEVS